MKFVTRAQWGARRPDGQTGISPELGTFHWEGTGLPWPRAHEACYSLVRGIQAYHMDAKGWDDIAYNAVPCPHGYIFEGRGPWVRSAANGTNEGNRRAYAICYLGGVGDPFTDEGKYAMADALAWLGMKDHNGHRDWKPTECPGAEIYEWQKAGMPLPTPPIPPTSWTITHRGLRLAELQEPMMRISLTTPLDKDGKAWLPLDGQADRPLVMFGDLISVRPHGSYPPVDGGYWPLIESGEQDRNGITLLTLEGGNPNGLGTVFLVVADHRE